MLSGNDPKCVEFFLNSIGTLWNLGVNPRFGEFYEAPSLPLVDLPPMAGLVSWDHSVQYTTPNLDDFSKGGGGGVQVNSYYLSGNQLFFLILKCISPSIHLILLLTGFIFLQSGYNRCQQRLHHHGGPCH